MYGLLVNWGGGWVVDIMPFFLFDMDIIKERVEFINNNYEKAQTMIIKNVNQKGDLI